MPAQSRKLFTFGYEGLDLEAFICRLREAGVTTIVDVRELPLSRKKGFSKRAFSSALAENGIAYLHAPQLGCPKPIRQRYQTDGDWAAYTKSFFAHLRKQRAAITELAKLAQTTSACLVCFEADFTLCHRTYVARETHKHGAPSVVHLTAKTSYPDLGLQAAA
jgi:uncharacterized protein (DUF488 family)